MSQNIIAKYSNRRRMEYAKVQPAEYGSDAATRQRLSRRTVFTSSCWVLLTAALLGIPSSRAYTLDTISPMVLSPGKSTGASMFGYTIAFWHKPDESRWLLVGAPDWEHGGALFQCSLYASLPLCKTLEVDRGEKTCLEQRCKDIVDSQRLGATLAVHEDTALVCAPNWSYQLTNKFGKVVDTPVGKCFYSENNALTNFTSFSPVYDMKNSSENLYYFNTGYCQAGFSALLLPLKQKVALGSPGCYSWTGDVMVGKPSSTTYANKTKSYSPGEDFGVPSSSTNVEPYNRFLGYSIAKGTFNNKLAVVTGAPKETRPSFMKTILNASVSVMEQLDGPNLKIWKQLYPPLDKGWYFSYCGYSVAVGDLNGDGLDDVAVGCPNYDDDKGAVLVYYQIKNADGTFKMELEKPDYRTGSAKGARYGTSVTVLSDIDGDGYQELAVGSPFTREGENSTGRLYIYCSTKGQDLPKTPCQEVAASAADVPGGFVRNFGWSATAHGASVAVSAPSSDVVLVFRTRPVVQLNVTVEAPNELDVSQLCSLESLEDAPCVNIRVCLQYTIRNRYTPMDSITRDMSVDVQLESMKALFFGTGTKSAQVDFNSEEGVESCKELKVYDRKKNEEIFEYTITARGSFTPAPDDLVVLDERHGLDSSAMLRMKVDCADATYDTCQPDVRVSIRQDGDFVLGDQDTVQLTVTIIVSGDPAYYPKLVLSSAGFMASSSEINVQGALGDCTENSVTHDIACSLGGVLQDTTATVTLSLSGSTKFYKNLKTGNDFFTVIASASCSSPIKVPSYGNDTKRVDISVKPEKLHLSRNAIPDELDLSTWEIEPSSTLESKGPKMVHSYEVDNPNKYDLYGVSLTIHWPQKHKEGYMLYTIRAPSFKRGDGETVYCEAVEGGGFDEEHLFETNTTDTDMSKTPSTTSGEQLGSADILPLVIQCALGDMSPADSFNVEVESYAFYQTFDKLKKNPVNSINSVGVVAPSSAPLGKTFTDSTTEPITTVVIYPKVPFQWWWYAIGAVVGLCLIILMGVLFKKCVIDPRTRKLGVVDEVDANETDNLDVEGKDEGGDAAEEETQNWEEAGETSKMKA